MQSDSERLAEANSCHDDAPQQAAALLREIRADALADAERPTFAFLLNHVLGEKLGAWGDAHRLHGPLLRVAGEATPAVLWRQAAVAAAMAKDGVAAAAATAGLAGCASVGLVQSQELVQLAAAGFMVPGTTAAQAGRLALAALGALDAAHWHTANVLDAAAAAACNNLAAELSERPLAELREPALRDALRRAALDSQRLWQRAGSWVNQARACYGVAVAAGALGDGLLQHESAARGLALLDRHDSQHGEDVDRAFLELELAHACRQLGRIDDAATAGARADALAAAFDDDSLTQWFQARVARHRQLLAG
ncbi:MAG: hypothetical protein ACRC2B_22715 [Rubrivivax sp.]